ncbi:MAG TPA: PfkB family carbohydrate kinase [Solirubrobacteraceae bacterium]|nr:PfkB family carbohydrate kinase [Solirubrobacteraceae bacterium]
MPRVAVVGHVEWVRFATVDHVPAAGEIVHAGSWFELAAGGGAVAAVQLRKLAGAVAFFTALGDDERGSAAAAQLREQGVELEIAARREPQREAFTFLSADAERTITVLGPRIVPHGSDDLGWSALEGVDGVYFTGGDVAALRHARRAKVLVATTRALDTLREAAIAVDALVASDSDAGERYVDGDVDPAPRYVVRTRGDQGGRWEGGGRSGTWPAAALPGPAVDAYGCGDAFAAGLTFAFAGGAPIDAAVELAARCGAAALCGRGPYDGQLVLAPER